VVGDPRPATLLGNSHIEGQSSNQVLHLDPEDSERGVFVNDGFEKLNADGEYSIELWMNPESTGWGGLASLVELPELDLGALIATRPQHRMAAIECMPHEQNRWMRDRPQTVSFFHRLSSREWGGDHGKWGVRNRGDWKKGDDHDRPSWPRNHGDDHRDYWKDWDRKRDHHDDADSSDDKNWDHGGNGDRGRNGDHGGHGGQDSKWARDQNWDRDRNGQVFSQQVYQPGSWHHIVAVREQNGIAVYINGQLAASMPLAANKDSRTYDLLIGRYSLADNWIGRPFSGHLDEFAVYDRALTAAEIQHHFGLVMP
jgi:hypothetical protein